MTLMAFSRILKSQGERPELEFKFHPKRRWRFDLALPQHMVAIEIEGGVWTNGRHVRGKGFLSDIEKYNEAAVLGWRVLRFTPDMLDGLVPLATLARMWIGVRKVAAR